MAQTEPTNRDPNPAPGEAARQNRRLILVALAAFVVGAVAVFSAEIEHARWVFSGLGLLNLWGLFLAALHLIYWRTADPNARFRATTQYFLAATGGLFLLVAALWLLRQPALPASEAGEHLLATALFLAAGVIQKFLSGFIRRSQELLHDTAATPLLLVLRASSYLLLLGAILAYLAPYTPAAVSWFFLAITFLALLLGLEAVLKNLLVFYQPVSLRANAGPAGTSSFLLAILGAPAGGKNLASQLEDLLGAKLQDIWVVRFAGKALPWAVLAILLGAWGTTALTVIPTGSHGVRVTFGKFAQEPLNPGLHFTAPWPFERVITVETDRRRQIILGLERDLGGPILWTRKHYEGEKNFLMANGEELLTISLPIIYHISNPQAFLQSTIDPNVALENLAYRQLLLHITGHDSFYVMTEAREELTRSIRESIQAEADALNLGLTITFLGFKDVHPPVEVTDYYQLVISAREQRETMIDEARAYRAERLPMAQQEAQRRQIEALATRDQRLAGAHGASNAFLTLSSAHQLSPPLFRFRRQMETLDRVLEGRRTIIVDDEVSESTDLFLELNSP